MQAAPRHDHTQEATLTAYAIALAQSSLGHCIGLLLSGTHRPQRAPTIIYGPLYRLPHEPSSKAEAAEIYAHACVKQYKHATGCEACLNIWRRPIQGRRVRHLRLWNAPHASTPLLQRVVECFSQPHRMPTCSLAQPACKKGV